ncbi:MAG: MOSC domain-containing protein [Candidatus Binataceae bacterium]
MAQDATVGAVASLWRYPVKSMMGERVASAWFTPHGMLGDRAFALIDKATGMVASAKNPRKWPNLFSFAAAYATSPQPNAALPPVAITLPRGDSVSSDLPDASRILAAALDREVVLACGAPEKPRLEEYWPDLDTLAHRDEVTDEAMPPATFFDCAPVHLLTTATLARLAEFYPEGRFEPKRFRPNILIAARSDAAGFVENGWVGHTIAVGAEVRIKITGSTGRCVMTTLAQDGLPRDLGILKAAAVHNGAQVGVYATIVRGGTVRCEDQLTIVD